jgi:hypothetical protein
MRKTLLALAFMSAFASAEEITVTGYGTNYNAALENAKVSALEKGASTFLIGERRARDGKVQEDITQYNGGIIRKYSILSHQQIPLGYEVTILADVITKNNNIKKQLYTDQLQDFKEKKTVIIQLNDMGKALYASISKPTYVIMDNYTKVSINIDLSWQPKWISDTKAFISVINDGGTISNNTTENIATSVLSTMTSYYGVFVGTLGGLMVASTATSIPENSDQMMVCFDEDKCSTVDLHIPKQPKLVIMGDKDVILHSVLFNTSLYSHIEAGDVVKSEWLNRYEKKYHQPAVRIHEEVIQRIPLTFIVKNDIIKSVKSLNVYVR